jgi:hypothetical protein
MDRLHDSRVELACVAAQQDVEPCAAAQRGEARRGVMWRRQKTQGGVRLMSQAKIDDLRASPHQIHSKRSLGASLMRGKNTSNNACVVYSTPPRLSAASWLAVARELVVFWRSMGLKH